MSNVFMGIIGVFGIFPFLGYFIVFFVSKQLTKNHRCSVSIALDLSVVLFIFSVHQLILVIWKLDLLWLVFLIMVLVGIFFSFMHWKTKQEIVYKRVFKGIWRTYFLLFSAAYIFLFFYGLIDKIVSYVAAP